MNYAEGGGREGTREGREEDVPAKLPAIQAAKKPLFSNMSMQGVMKRSSSGK